MANLVEMVAAALTRRPNDPFAVMTKAICDGAGAAFGSKDQRAQLANAQRCYEETERIIMLCTPDKARDAWQQHQRDLQAAIARGDLSKLDGYSRAEIESEYVAKGEAARAERLRITMDLAPLVRDLSEQFAGVAEKFAAEQAKAEADAYSRFGVNYPGPSTLVKALRQAADLARARVPRGEGFPRSPRDLVPFVNF